MAYIYLIRNLVNGKGYVGKTEVGTPASRFHEHKKTSKYGSDYALHRAIRKYGPGNFKVSEVVFCDALLINDLEKHYIKFYGTFSPTGHGYNMTLGGEGQSGYIPTEETRARLSASTRNHLSKNPHPLLGTKWSDEKRIKFSLSRKGKPSSKKGIKTGPNSKEHNRKISESNKGRLVSEKTRLLIGESNRGQTRSQATKNKLISSHLGKVQSEETKAKMSAAHKARWAIMSNEDKDLIYSKLRGKKAPPRSEQWKLAQRESQSKRWSEARRLAQLRKGAPNSHDN